MGLALAWRFGCGRVLGTLRVRGEIEDNVVGISRNADESKGGSLGPCPPVFHGARIRYRLPTVAQIKPPMEKSTRSSMVRWSTFLPVVIDKKLAASLRVLLPPIK